MINFSAMSFYVDKWRFIYPHKFWLVVNFYTRCRDNLCSESKVDVSIQALEGRSIVEKNPPPPKINAPEEQPALPVLSAE